MARIKAGKLRFLVATDVAARGIDISDLSCVIGYSAPESPEVYIHRTGRTGRVGKAGVAISLVSGLDIGNFRQLQQVNQIEIAERKLPTEEEILARLRDRLSVKIEQEVRHLPEHERKWRVDRFVPIVESLVATPDGRRDLAAVCAAYLHEVPAGGAPAASPTGGAGRGRPAGGRSGKSRSKRRTRRR
jgi:ATP-dependent RNA helicase DeaD